MVFIDELESTHSLVGDSLTMFAEAFRELTDEESQVGLFLIVTARAFEELPSFLDPKSGPPGLGYYVARRIGLSNYILMDDYTEEELRELIRSAIKFRREENFNVSDVIKNTQTKEEILAEEYPFTSQAIDLVLEKVKAWKDGGLIPNLRPREVLEILDSCLSIALQENLPIIDSNVVVKVCENIERYLIGGK
jgi:Cdc6-like AAA superfamily ATPase